MCIRFDIAHGASEYSGSWTQEERFRYEQSTKEEQAEMAESKWAEFVHQKALKYLRSKAAEWEDSSRKMESLGKLDKGIAGVTLGIIGAGTMAGAYIEYGGVAVLKILAKGFVGSTVAGG